MTTVTIEDAQAKLPELIGGLAQGQELVITQGDRVVARIVGERPEVWERPGPGLAKGIFSIVADDDEHLNDFAESMPFQATPKRPEVEPGPAVICLDQTGKIERVFATSHHWRSGPKSGRQPMATMNLEEIQPHLGDVIAGLNPGEPLVILQDGEPVATLTRSEARQWPCKAGSAKTEGYWMSPDFDAPLEEFCEYMD